MRRRASQFIAVVLVTACIGGAGYWYFTHRVPCPATAIFQGVRYQCVQLAENDQGSGLMHVVIVDLSAPGVGIFLTPLDAQAKAAGWEYRLQKTADAVRNNDLAVAINGTLYGSDSGWIRQRGDLANSSETVVSEHQINHVDANSYLIWFEDDLTPHLERSKPFDPALVPKMRYAIGGHEVVLRDGKARPNTTTVVDHRTMVAIAPERRLLYLAVFEKVSFRRAAEELAQLGAKEGVMLDGGTSTAMTIGAGAKNIRAGNVMGDWRPVAVHFGVRAKPIDEK